MIHMTEIQMIFFQKSLTNDISGNIEIKFDSYEEEASAYLVFIWTNKKHFRLRMKFNICRFDNVQPSST